MDREILDELKKINGRITALGVFIFFSIPVILLVMVVLFNSEP